MRGDAEHNKVIRPPSVQVINIDHEEEEQKAEQPTTSHVAHLVGDDLCRRTRGLKRRTEETPDREADRSWFRGWS